MRILQIIDSLEIGGAEKMAVTFANSLANKIEFSGLIATRKEGNLKKTINSNVNYFFLDKRNIFHPQAYLRLRKYCKVNKVEFIHAHSSSYFTSCLIKMTMPKIKIVWHDHNGVGNIPVKEGTFYLQMFSVFFSGVISVNKQLETWALKYLFCKKVTYLPNFVIENKNYARVTALKGEAGKRILHLANLRHQKNHSMLLDVAKVISAKHKDWTFHLVGKDFNDAYSKDLKEKIVSNNLQNHVFLYDSREDIENIISQSEIALFTSKSEGLPVALLEYGLYKKPVVSTSVGEIPFIICNGLSGYLTKVDDVATYSNCLSNLILNENVRKDFANALHNFVVKNNSEEAIVQFYLNWIKKI
ncbi:glycosyltransferase [Flavobacterium sp. SUN052]|uniref:glycosyltransferase n=1 Tax=Flavobacterium sp. SUN052 TaxID=3002441 RepID=UPI00237E5EC3|nr:glycosyltransferase [Flavobacterium sp. SUN052]MEC4004387.1 glycosyltransferase [Flavobacterium sp. SUN052]